MIGENYMKQIIISLKHWVNNNFALKENIPEELTEDEVLQILIECEVIDPVTDENSNILFEQNNTILIY